jgi:undecaprenyl-diphosphatase
MSKAIKTILTQCNRVDINFCLKLNQLSKYPVILNFFNFISWLGNGKIWYLIIFIIPFICNIGIKISVELIFFGLIGTIIYKILKNTINRPRPYKINQSINLGGKILDQFSFPSGHTLHSVIFSLILIYHFPILTEILAILTLLIGLSRVILGMHFPSDVFVGALLGYLIFKLFLIYRNYENIIYL